MLLALMLLAAGPMWQPASYPHMDDHRAAQRLAEYINEERSAHGLPPVPVSVQLNKVAQAHVRDLMENRPDSDSDSSGQRCTMHSWSAAGDWSPVCFTADNSRAAGMWNKPQEISRGRYRGYGFEIAYRMGAGATPEAVMDGWLASPRHEAVILEHGVWRNANWQAMGVAIHGDYAVAWFGKEPDSGR